MLTFGFCSIHLVVFYYSSIHTFMSNVQGEKLLVDKLSKLTTAQNDYKSPKFSKCIIIIIMSKRSNDTHRLAFN